MMRAYVVTYIDRAGRVEKHGDRRLARLFDLTTHEGNQMRAGGTYSRQGFAS